MTRCRGPCAAGLVGGGPERVCALHEEERPRRTGQRAPRRLPSGPVVGRATAAVACGARASAEPSPPSPSGRTTGIIPAARTRAPMRAAMAGAPCQPPKESGAIRIFISDARVPGRSAAPGLPDDPMPIGGWVEVVPEQPTRGDAVGSVGREQACGVQHCASMGFAVSAVAASMALVVSRGHAPTSIADCHAARAPAPSPSRRGGLRGGSASRDLLVPGAWSLEGLQMRESMIHRCPGEDDLCPLRSAARRSA